MYRPLWRGAAVIYSSEAGAKPAEAVAAALRSLGAAAHVFRLSYLSSIWGCYDAYIFVMAAGGVVRYLCEKIGHKHEDPPVLVASHDLKYIIPLLGMHRGANRLASTVAQALGGTAVVTTVAEMAGFAPVEDLEWAMLCDLDPGDKLEVYRRLVSGGEVCVDADIPPLPGYVKGRHCEVTIKRGCTERFCCRPWRLFAGFGAKSSATVEDVVEAVKSALGEVGAAGVEAVASIRPIVRQVAEALGARALLFRPEELRDSRCASPPSDLAKRAVGVGNVAELSALAAAGPGAELVYRKKAFFNKVTVALAKARA